MHPEHVGLAGTDRDQSATRKNTTIGHGLIPASLAAWRARYLDLVVAGVRSAAVTEDAPFLIGEHHPCPPELAARARWD